MRRGCLVFSGALGGVVLVVAGCSSHDTKSASPSTSAASPTSAGTAAIIAEPSGPNTKVVIDGKDRRLAGTVVCSAMDGSVNIAIGNATGGVGVVVSAGDSPAVRSVGLGSVNGVTLAYQHGTGQGDAKAEKDGNTYTISGTATGTDMANPLHSVSKPFEIKVSCP